MKKITFLVAIILVGFVANATAKNVSVANNKVNRFDQNQPIEFNERGIQFYVFANGEFDFNTRPDESQGGYYYKNAGSRLSNPNRCDQNYGVLIENDSYGRIRRIGNTFINYDFNNRVTRIGSVFLRYNRFALVQVGGLQLIYNRFGELVDCFGTVKGRRNSGFYYGNNGYNGFQNNSMYSNNNYQNGNYGYNNGGHNQNNSSDYYYRNSNKKNNDSLNSGSEYRRE
jgi:hypothetical protein